MADVEINVTGARELAADLGRLGRDLESIDLTRAGDQIQEELRSLSPVRTGTLRSSWDVTPEGGEVSVGSDLVYAAVQNFGGYHNITGQHFVERAAELSTDDTGRVVAAEVDRLIARM